MNTKNRTILYYIIVMTILILFLTDSRASVVVQNGMVSASVNQECIIDNVKNVNFQNYDPTSQNPDDLGVGSITFSCVEGTLYHVYISGTRQLTDGEDVLSFELYTDSARKEVWPCSFPGLEDKAPSSPVILSVYGRISACQDVGIGDYSGNLMVNVEF